MSVPLSMSAPPRPAPTRPVSTYSIVARDPTGQMGVACQSHWFAVGALAPWAEAGVGAVATQAFAEPSYGPGGLRLMKEGQTASRALETLLARDKDAGLRQVGMVDARGGVATHTGSRNLPEAGGASGDGFVCQANLMKNPTVWTAMARAFEGASGDLAERMLLALDAAEAEGGDLRGRRSAALLVVKAEASGEPWAGFVFNLRVDDHAEPLSELRRLVRLQRAFNHMQAGGQAVAAKDFATAQREYEAAESLEPDNPEILFWHGFALLSSGDLIRAGALLHKAFAADPSWRTLAKRLLQGDQPEAAGLQQLIGRLLDFL